MKRLRIVQVLVATVTCLALADIAHAGPQTRKRTGPRPKATTGTRPAPRRAAAAKSPTLPCGDYLGFQVLLDREGFSPGVIDGRPGSNFDHAVAALQAARKLTASGKPDCDMWKALNGGESAEPTIATYTVTEDDVKGPFEKQIPRSLADQAKLESLGYQSPLEALAERFHASPALLQRLNPGAMTAGRQIKVPGVTPFDANAKPAPAGGTGVVTILVSKDDSSLRVTKADGTVVLYAPVTTGSEHDPLPTGDYKVTGVAWRPPFHYNPDLFWDAKATDEKALIKPGPNNPVGVAWVSLSLEHYGLHGTPEPANVGHTESHGCVRLTNWDVARLVSLVKPGTPVQFR